ncbi:FGGY-family carbohydrate kinase [Polyangium spumosum]|uniref:Ribulokinase n=1 Tax=Polyangium spumosum TaxID=889282 RepID=A0A6N7PLR2_9BACT|nr:FGGY-family carbohydrate kinase [Polyangium spumosum]MRG91190.1 ribulokinase [Polyangium spumosum]
MQDRHYLGIDVGTGSVRAALFDGQGHKLGIGVRPISLHRPAPDFVEQSSDEIWSAACEATRAALGEAGDRPERVVGVGFDATCSLVLLDEGDRPVTVSPSGDDRWNVIVWMDHRAIEEATRINAGGHEVLRYVGGVISPEMQTPKLAWLKRHMGRSFRRAARFLDLPDFMAYRATGSDVRSLCTTVCKWTYLGHEPGEGGSIGRWDDAYFRAIGLGELVDEGYTRIGKHVRPMGERAGGLTERAAAELGLCAGTAVAVPIIDAHAGGLGLLGIPTNGVLPDEAAMEERLALIGGTSTCHMASSRQARFVPGVWGPYSSAMIPGLWLTEGGQSATGALIDHVIHTHARGAELAEEARRRGTTVYALLNERLDVLATKHAFPAELARDVHVLPDHHGNRSPRADPTLRGMVSGLGLADDVDALAILYLATIQALAHGTRHILAAMNAAGYRIEALHATGGDTKNPVFVREHADVTGCRVILPREPEAVLLGAAMLGAVASGDRPTVLAAMGAMSEAGAVVLPTGGDVKRFHDRKHRVFLRMYEDQMAYRALMRDDA